MNKKLLIFSFAMALTVSANAQGYFSFYQLRELIPQTQSLQPAFIPNNSFTAAMPGLNLGASLDADFKLQDLLAKETGSIDYAIDFDVLLAAASDVNQLNLDVTSNLFHFGLKTKKGAFSLFGNVRATVHLQYEREFMDFLANGNAGRIGETIDFGGTRLMANSYHEIGLGYSRHFLGEKLTLGARVKQITGLFHASLAEGATGSITTAADDYSWQIMVQNGTANTAGLDLFLNDQDYSDNALQDYIMSNGNSTLAFDFGAKFKPFKWLHFEASVNDIGTITYKEQARNYNTEDATVNFSGVQLRGLENSGDVFRDSLETKFTSNETQREFTTDLTMRTYLSASLFLGERNRFTVMAFNNHVFDEIDPSYAVGWNHSVKKFTFGVLGSYRGSQNELNFGANIASDIGPVQLYLAMDNALATNRPEQYSKADIRFGINLMFGYKKWANRGDVIDLDEL